MLPPFRYNRSSNGGKGTQMDLRETVSFITGGASGLGAATAHRFVDAGGRVMLVDMDAAAGEALAAELGEAAQFVAADVTREDEVTAAITATQEAFGSLHVLVNCAGIGLAMRTYGRQGVHPLDLFERVIRINLVGTFNVIRLCVPVMMRNTPDLEGERGVIINSASVAAYEGQIGQVAYAASKGGVVGMNLPLARDLARNAIRVVAVAPGLFDTPMLAGLPEVARISLGKQVPNPPRLGQPEEFAQTAQFIVEASYLNGEVLRLDGAMRMAPR